ncbi:hypothetical protein NOX90_02280 [Wolbachia endosymbiont of Anurida maritima]|uniref:hypothetical protein n=1 Tax=Wolbachia endosymbiont of Anurida maritima TaxID=2850562 RepID=UPI0035D0460D
MYAVANPESFTKNLVPYYENKVVEMRKLMNEFDEKTVLGLWWDSKVPEKDKVKEWSKFWKMPFTNISFLGVSDSKEVTEEIKKYFKLYGEIEKIAQEVSQVVEQEGINAAEPQINALRVKLQEGFVA